jgi:hypothetical protein
MRKSISLVSTLVIVTAAVSTASKWAEATRTTAAIAVLQVSKYDREPQGWKSNLFI